MFRRAYLIPSPRWAKATDGTPPSGGRNMGRRLRCHLKAACTCSANGATLSPVASCCRGEGKGEGWKFNSRLQSFGDQFK